MAVILPPAALGNYVVAVALSQPPLLLFSALTNAMAPRMLSARSPSEAGRRGIRLLGSAAVLGALAALALFLCIPFLVRVLFGNAFLGAVPSAQVLAFGSVLQGCNQLAGTLLRMLDRPGIPAICESAGLVVTVALLFLLLPRLGIVGAAIASLVAYASVLALHLMAIRWVVRSADSVRSAES